MPPRRISSWISFWLPLLVVAVLALGASRAHAQVFRPRNAKAITTRTVATPGAPGAIAGKKPAPAAAPGATAKPAVKANPARRAVVKKKRKPRADDDTVVIDDDEEEEDVKITDD